eukprot:6197990-Pleurochrysis_carterae.AAC.4
MLASAWVWREVIHVRTAYVHVNQYAEHARLPLALDSRADVASVVEGTLERVCHQTALRAAEQPVCEDRL